MRRRFFVEQFEGNSASLRGEAAEHLGRVLRAETGQLYELSDGEKAWLGRIEHVAVSKHGASRIEFALIEPIAVREPSFEAHLLISLVKFDRFEWCLEKATELGVTCVVPLAAARSDKALIAAAGKRRARWERILLESAQQSRRLGPPALHQAMIPEKAFRECAGDCKILLSERPGAPLLREKLSSATDISAAALAFGPEGGWTDGEIESGGRAGFVEASLGENILRTETAVLASLAIVRYAAGV